MTGPVQVLVVGLDQPTFSGAVMNELDRLRDTGTARLLDIVMVERAEDGTFETLPNPPGAPAGTGSLAASILGTTEPEDGAADGLPDGSTWSLADAIPVGTSAAVALIEHVWAIPLRDAIERAGGTPLEEAWLVRADVERLERLIGQPSD